MLPFWTNFLIRTYAWIVLLNSAGLVNKALMALRPIDKPLELLYTQGAIVAGLLYAYLPLMILPLYASIERLDPQLREAAANLGAGPLEDVPRRDAAAHAARRASPGACSSSCRASATSSCPSCSAAARPIMVGNLIRDQFLKARDWPFGATLALGADRRADRRCFAPAGVGAPPADRRWRQCVSSAGTCPFWMTYVFLYIADRRPRRHVLQRLEAPVRLRVASSLQWYGELLRTRR